MFAGVTEKPRLDGFRTLNASLLARRGLLLQTVAVIHNLGELPIRRPNRAPPAATKDGPRTNDEIRNAQVQLIDQEGLNHGTVETVADFIIGARPRSEEHTSELQSR